MPATREYLRNWHVANPDRNREYQRRMRRKAREDMFEHYGRVCACCNIDEPVFLTLDHIGGGGLADRKKSGNTRNIIARLRREGWPPGYRVLCFNCNLAVSIQGFCPHTRKDV